MPLLTKVPVPSNTRPAGVLDRMLPSVPLTSVPLFSRSMVSRPARDCELMMPFSVTVPSICSRPNCFWPLVSSTAFGPIVSSLSTSVAGAPLVPLRMMFSASIVPYCSTSSRSIRAVPAVMRTVSPASGKLAGVAGVLVQLAAAYQSAVPPFHTRVASEAVITVLMASPGWLNRVLRPAGSPLKARWRLATMVPWSVTFRVSVLAS